MRYQFLVYFAFKHQSLHIFQKHTLNLNLLISYIPTLFYIMYTYILHHIPYFIKYCLLMRPYKVLKKLNRKSLSTTAIKGGATDIFLGDAQSF